MIHSEFRFEGAGGLPLFGQNWLPDNNMKALLGIVHGIGEHSGRYENVVNGVLKKGIGVTAFDLRGHGRSSGPRGHVKSWSEYLADLEMFLGIVRTRYPDLPVFLLGHSLGSLIAAEYALENRGGLAGVVLSSVAIEPVGAAKPVLVLIARLLSGICPKFPIQLKLETGALSGDRTAVHRYQVDPLVHGIGTARLGTEALDAIKRLKSLKTKFVIPVLVLHGGADRINTIDGAREFFGRTASSGGEFHEYADGYHELHNDLDKERVITDLSAWIDRLLDRSIAPDKTPPIEVVSTRRFDDETHPSGWSIESAPLSVRGHLHQRPRPREHSLESGLGVDWVNRAKIPFAEGVGHYESYFQRANHPTRPLAFWIRYTAFMSKAQPSKDVGQLWAIYFNGENGAITSVKEELPLDLCRFSPRRLSVQIGTAYLEEFCLRGRASSKGRAIEWRLRYAGDQPPLLLLPRAHYDRSFPAAKALVGMPFATYSGELIVNGEGVAVDGWVGSQNHNWGRRHTDQYAWGQVAGFDNDRNAFLECATARLRLGPLWTPWLTNVVLRLAGKEYRLNSIRQGISAKGRIDNLTWRFSSETPDVKISGRMAARKEDFVRLVYENPPGGTKTCLNSKIASCDLVVERSGMGPLELSTRSRAAFEIVKDEEHASALAVA